MIADDLCNECKSEASSRGLVRDKGIEEMFRDVGRNPWTIIADAKLERQADRAGRRIGFQADTGPECRGQFNFAVDRIPIGDSKRPR